MLTFGLPSGIGDVSWALSKLLTLREPIAIEIADGWPPRTVPFLELLPQIKQATYGPFSYQDIVMFEQSTGIGHHPRWESLRAREMGRMLIEPNRHLEMGRRLEDWLPDLPTNFHYEILTHLEDPARAATKLGDHPRPWTAISAASYRGAEAWKTWGFGEWSEFLAWYKAEVGGTVFLIGGFWDDLTDSLADLGYPSLVGRTSIGTVVEILKALDFYVGFSSGLGVIRTVLNKNAFCLWPDHQVELSTSWAPPDMLENGTYAAQLWRPVETVKPRVRNWLKRCA